MTKYRPKKASFLNPINPNTDHRRKGREKMERIRIKRKERKRDKKKMVALLAFILATEEV